MESTTANVTTFLPLQVNLFGTTRLERLAPTTQTGPFRFRVRVPYVGITSGEMHIWCDLDLRRLRAEEKGQAQGILAEASNILAGMTLSGLADHLDGKVMLAPPILERDPAQISTEGTDYRLHLMDGHCHCRVVMVVKEHQ